MDPQEIEHVEFRTTRLKEGYDPDQVDAFLDRVAGELRLALTQLQERDEQIVKLKRQLAEQERMLGEYDNFTPTQVLPTVSKPEPDGVAPVTATLILEAAQKTADEVISQAQSHAVDITKVAESNARERADEIVADAIKRRDTIQAKVTDLENTLTIHRDKSEQVKRTLQDMLARLENPQ